MKKLPSKFKIINNNKLSAKILRKLHWNEQLHCPHCGCIDDIKKHSNQKNGINRYFCNNCMKTFTDLTGTIFEKSKIPIWKWIYCIILLLEKTGCLSAAELSRTMEISYPTAWNMLNKIRGKFKHKNLFGQLDGIIESDEAWISHKKNQQIVLGIVERSKEKDGQKTKAGRVKLFPIVDRKEDQLLLPHLLYVKKKSFVCTDGHQSYGALSIDFIHHWVNHSNGEFKRNDIWTNTIEGVWSMLKGIIRTIHHGISKKYMPDYFGLFSFKYNNRDKSIDERFNLFLKHVCQPRYCLY